jgi:DNA-binding GntR family transcriptional regulator
MARKDTRFRTALNMALETLAGLPPGAPLPSENALSNELKVSRTIVRAILKRLDETGVIAWSGRDKLLLRTPDDSDRLPERDEYISLRELEHRFLDWILRFDVPAETPLNVTQLARHFSVPPHMLSEFLASLNHFGLVERRPLGGWLLLGFTIDYALELSEFRTLLEVNAARSFAILPPDDPAWQRLNDLEARHRALLKHVRTDYAAFSPLDEEFHETINSVVSNRFVADFQKVISLIFHYHYQWDKRDAPARNEAAIQEHLQIIAALRTGNPDRAEISMREHLVTSKETLVASLRVNRLA